MAHIPWKAGILTALLVLVATSAQAESNNPEDGAQTGDATQETTPCTVLILGTEQPIVDPHPECVGSVGGSGQPLPW